MYGNLLFALTLLIFLAGCVKPIAPRNIVAEHVGVIDDIDATSKANSQKLAQLFYYYPHLLDADGMEKITTTSNTAFVYYMAAHVALAQGDTERFQELIKLATDILAEVAPLLPEFPSHESESVVPPSSSL